MYFFICSHKAIYLYHIVNFSGASNVPSLSDSDVLYKKSFRMTICRRYMLKTKAL